ncbi:tRNA-dihydrouridine synthase A [Ventosimonas gracilis]|uniref:tRNA-dihydrouridine(20/20a) synthase n=1 Tax=Ventosimonas gracilis TaxID=1680762 RepID=A0A139SXU3_9GAMM|nr:tRNA dihydrouridine(20/20a) synthase DusA [Ventosimonas gracilis]KXU39437.1 tRNA-dihydrouridine synthase A [Ventosimonas gracilis]
MNNRKNPEKSVDFRICIAPMLDWTDSHCRYFHRLLSQKVRLYTEMVTCNALLHGDAARYLRFSVQEHPLALQLGGSEPRLLAQCAKLAADFGYDEVNLNCGCPSERVQRGSFGACLMENPKRVADGFKAMQDAVDIPVSIKHRIGLDKNESYAFVRDFVGTLFEAGCRHFIVHARNAWLGGLSPKENREIPPLRHEVVWQLKRDFADGCIVINGGIQTDERIQAQLQKVDGVMIGRAAYHYPWWLASFDEKYYREPPSNITREQVEAQMVRYMERERLEHGTPWHAIARHMLGLRHGLKGARRWRQVWSDHRLKSLPPDEVARLAAAHH